MEFVLALELFVLPGLLLFMLPAFELLVLFEFPAFEFMFPPMFELPVLLLFVFPALAFEFEFMFELLAFPLALPFALSAGVQAVQTLATARRVRSASVLRIEFPPVPVGGQSVEELRGPSHAFTPPAFSLQLVGLVLRRRRARPFGSSRTFRGRALPHSVSLGRGSGRPVGRPSS